MRALIGHVGIGEKARAPLSGQLLLCGTQWPSGATRSKYLPRHVSIVTRCHSETWPFFCFRVFKSVLCTTAPCLLCVSYVLGWFPSFPMPGAAAAELVVMGSVCVCTADPPDDNLQGTWLYTEQSPPPSLSSLALHRPAIRST